MMGVSLAALGRTEEAIAHYRKALRFKPDYAEAYGNLGFALARLGRRDESIAQYRESLRIDPDFQPVYYDIDIASAVRGSGPKP